MQDTYSFSGINLIDYSIFWTKEEIKFHGDNEKNKTSGYGLFQFLGMLFL